MSWAKLASQNLPEVQRNLPQERKQALKLQQEKDNAKLEAAKEEVEDWRRCLRRAIVENVGEPIPYEHPMELETLEAIWNQNRELNSFRETEEFKFLQLKLKEAEERYNALL